MPFLSSDNLMHIRRCLLYFGCNNDVVNLFVVFFVLI